MSMRPFTKTALLRGCASAAMLAGAALTAQAAQAQAFNATPTAFDPAKVTIDRATPGVDTITVLTDDASIDWRPTPDGLGGALTFLPDGNVAIFQNGVNNTDFAILNRILDTGLGPAVFEGLVQSFAVGNGFVAFSSPSGIIVGSTGRFEVPQLMLTTQTVSVADMTSFFNGNGPMLVSGFSGSVDIQAGASIRSANAADPTGGPEDSFLIVAAPQITMAGDAYYNGSIAYIASSTVFVSHSSGLFDILVSGGVFDGQVITHTGSSGGPASTGAGDEHVIYGVTQADFSGGPVSMLFSGNLGFDTAASASVVNGDIILSANYSVSGRDVDGDNNRSGAASFFDGRGFDIGVPADILLTGLDATSNLLAITTDTVNLDATTASSAFAADLSLVGRQQASISADNGAQVTVGGDLLVSARNFGLNTQFSSEENATGGFASVRAGIDSLVSVAGDTMVAASAIPGLDFNDNTIGFGTGGTAEIVAAAGTVSLTGDVSMEAYARTDQTSGPFAGYDAMTGGSVNFLAFEGGTLTALGILKIDASASTPGLTAADATFSANATGGNILIGIGDTGATIEVGGEVSANADALIAADNFTTGTGPSAFGGSVSVQSFDFSTFNLQANVLASARAQIDAVTGGGSAGIAQGGTTAIDIADSDLLVGGVLSLDTSAIGGTGDAGGAAIGGSANINIANGALTIGNILQIAVDASAGDANGTGDGGNADSGDSTIQLAANGELIVSGAGSSSISADASAGQAASGLGGNATAGDLRVIADGAGASAAFAGQLAMSGNTLGGDAPSGTGGSATGGLVVVEAANGGSFSATVGLDQSSFASGGDGATGGAASGGSIGVDAVLGGQISLGAYSGAADATGGSGLSGDGGSGLGGNLVFDITGGTFAATADVALTADGTGGNATGGNGGAGQGGSAALTVDGTALGISGSLTLQTDATGGETATAGFSGGSAVAGNTTLDIVNGGDASAGSLFLRSTASGGGAGPAGTGGSADGGFAGLTISGAGSALTVTGSLLFETDATGADTTGGTGIGGGATGGDVALTVSAGGLFDFAGAGSAALESVATAGDSLVSNGSGGAAASGTIDIAITTSATVSGSSLALSTSATGGSQAGGATGVTGGDASAGAIAIDVSGGSSLASGITAASTASGGLATTGGGGLATSGNVLLTGTNSVLGLGTTAVLASDAFGGSGTAGGDATSGNAGVDLAGTSVSGGALTLRSLASGGNAGAGVAATAGDAFFVSTGAVTIDLASISLISNGQGVTGTAQSGTVLLDTGAASLTAPLISLNSDATGTAVGTPGQALVLNSGGSITADTLTLSAQGSNAGPQAQIVSDGGLTTIANALNATTTGDLLVSYLNGGSIIGGSGLASLTASFDFLANGVLTLAGDSAAQPGIASSALFATARDIDISATTSVLGTSTVLTSLDLDNTAIIGGTSNGAGFSLLADEIARFSGQALEIVVPQLAVATDLAATVDAFTIVGSGGSGTTEYVRLALGGPSQVIGQISYTEAGANDLLEINSTDYLHLVLPDGGIAIADTGGAPAGSILITGSRILAVDSALAALILADPTDPAIAPALLDDGGAVSATSYISGGGVEFSVSDLLFGQNTGANGVFGGITVGAGGLVIDQPGSLSNTLNVIAFGLQDNGGAQVTNNDWFYLVQFNVDRAGTYDAGATFNDCIIVTSSCPFDDIEVPGINQILVEQPVAPKTVAEEGATSDSEFGFDFPSLVDAPLISEDEVIREPVTSGGDSAVYALVGGEEDDDDDEENARGDE